MEGLTILGSVLAAFDKEIELPANLPLIGTFVRGVRNHSKTGREGFHIGALVPAIVGRSLCWSTNVDGVAIVGFRHFVDGRMPVQRLVFHPVGGTETGRGIANVLVRCVGMEILGPVKLRSMCSRIR